MLHRITKYVSNAIILGKHFKYKIILSITCSGEAEDNCLTCDSTAFRYKLGSECVCKDGYFDLLNSLIC